ncbi:MAG: hypothetical protein Q9201_002246 [Fulgogasparrea decipioides]
MVSRYRPPDDDPTLLDRYARFASLDDFLHYYFIGMNSLLQARHFEALPWEYFVRAGADGVVHAEVSFDPQAQIGQGIKYSTVVEGFIKGCRRAEGELGMTTRLILCLLRHLPVSEAAITFGDARDEQIKGCLAGIGLDSSKKAFPPGVWEAI